MYSIINDINLLNILIGIILSIPIGIISGIISSVISVYIIRRYNLRSLRKKYSHLAGKYYQETIDGRPIKKDDKRCTTEIKYKEGNILLTVGEGFDGHWDGVITMNLDASYFGTGTYQYRGKKDCGRHEIQYSPEDKSIYVLTINTSHGGNSNFSHLWKRSRAKNR